MKRLLPLLLGLAVSVAQADSNSDYRAGSDFARQIQGQGTGSIQGFKPQESIPTALWEIPDSSAVRRR